MFTEPLKCVNVFCENYYFVFTKDEVMKDYMQYVEVNPKVMFGKPVVKDTRITVELILEELAAGKTPEELMNAHPKLSLVGIWASLQFAADALKGERTYPIAI